MLNQKIQNPNPDELMIEVDLCYELDPYELKLDEMIEAMYTVGKKLPAEHRETALGGCAATPSACEKCHLCS